MSRNNNLYIKANIETENKIKTAFWLLYTYTNIEKISIQNITDKCGIHRSTFYNHFHDVYEVLEKIEDSLMQELKDIQIPNVYSEADILIFGEKLFLLFQSQQDYLHILIVEQKDIQFSRTYRAFLKSKFQSLIYDDTESLSTKDLFLLDTLLETIINIYITCADKKVIDSNTAIQLLRGFVTRGFHTTLSDMLDKKDFTYPFSE